jgi:RNA recognition motif-containing protein
MRSVGDVIRVEIMTDSDGKSKGYGICEFSQERFAKKAIECLNETEFQGRVIYVREDIKNAADDRTAEVKGFERSKSKNSDNRSIYIWNLSYDTTKRELEDHFRRTGNIETATLLTGSDGRSLGCAVVVYQEAKGADRALRELDATMLDGREVRIREDRGHNENRPRDRKDVMNSSSCQLYVGNLSFQTTWQELKDHFRQCGRVDHVDVIEGPDGRKKGFGIVKFSNIDEAERAIDELDGVELHGRELDVRFDKRT